MKKLVAVTGCPTGIAHTYMAAESLSKAAEKLGVSIKVETRGASGVENRLTEEEIREAHAVILSSDVDAEEDRFQGKTVIRSSLGDAIKNAERLIEEALSKPAASYEDRVKAVKKEREQKRSGPYKHLMNGVSFMIPLVVAGGLMHRAATDALAAPTTHSSFRAANTVLQPVRCVI